AASGLDLVSKNKGEDVSEIIINEKNALSHNVNFYLTDFEGLYRLRIEVTPEDDGYEYLYHVVSLYDEVQEKLLLRNISSACETAQGSRMADIEFAAGDKNILVVGIAMKGSEKPKNSGVSARFIVNVRELLNFYLSLSVE